MIEAETLLAAAQKAGVMIVTAESCTGGMVSASITDVAGSSAVFDRGFVTYTNDAKIQLLAVNPMTLEAFGAVSEQTALEMARGALTHSNAQLSVATTGIAGPGGSDHKPEGRVCFGIATRHGVSAETVEFGAIGRKNVRVAATKHALKLLLDALKTLPLSK